MVDYSYNWWLVAASFAVALMAGFTGLSLTEGASKLDPASRKWRIVMAAVALGGGIWSMHFVAMLGLRLPVLFYYDLLITLISALLAILVVGVALLVLHFLPRSRTTITLAGGIVGVGIPAMHYVGMLGMEVCRPVFSVAGVAFAALASVALSVAAIWVAYGERTRRSILLGTVCFGIAVFAVHFIAMGGTGFVKLDGVQPGGQLVGNESLAIVVTLSAFVICGAFLLTGVTFLPDAAVAADAIGAPAVPGLAMAEPGPFSAMEPPAPVSRQLPYEKEGRTLFVDATAVSAIRADGHYTVLFVGAEKFFCPWSITRAEERLAGTVFLRCHRSYLVNPARVAGFERAKDNGVLTFEAGETPLRVPVSRSRLGAIRESLGL